MDNAGQADGSSVSMRQRAKLCFGLTISDWFVCITLSLTVALIGMDMTIVSIAIPSITTQLGSLSDVGWYGSAYFLAAAASQLAFGALNRVVPHKYVFLAGVVLFEFGCLLTGLATSSVMAIIGRAFTGLGSSGVVSTAVVIITQIVPPPHLPFLIGALGSLELLGQILGPLVGGAITDHISWRWCFLINVPFGFLSGIAAFFCLRTYRTEPWAETLKGLKKLDAIGIAILLPAIIAVLYVIQSGGNSIEWNSSEAVGTLMGGLVLFIILYFREKRRGDDAVLPLRLFKDRSILFGAAFAFSANMSVSLFDYFVPFWNQAIRGLSAERAGILLLPLNACSAFSVVAAGAISNFLRRPNPVMICGGALTIAAAILFSTIDINATDSKILGYSALAGFSAMATQQPLVVAHSAVDKFLSPAAISLMLFSSMSGGALGLAVAQAIFVNELQDNLAQVPGVNADAIIASGATEVRSVVNPALLGEVLRLYNLSLVQVFFVPVGAACLMLISGCLVSWKKSNLEHGSENTLSGESVTEVPENTDEEKAH